MQTAMLVYNKCTAYQFARCVIQVIVGCKKFGAGNKLFKGTD